MSDSDKTLEEQKRKKEFAIMEVNNWIERISKRKSRKPVGISAGYKYLSPTQALNEIKADTYYGKKLVKMFDKVRLEKAKRRKK